MSAVDALLARSRSPGTFVERSTFTLSRDKAIEKQREFALRHPAQYVLELIQAAVLSDATYVAVESSPSSILVAWVGGTPLKSDQLSHLMDYLFADRTDPATRPMVQMAVGINALLQRNPTRIVIESGDGEQSIRMGLTPDGQGEVGQVAEAIAGTYISATLRSGWFDRFTQHSHTEETSLIEERCMYAPVPILLNGRAPFGYRASTHIEIFGARAQRHFSADGRRGVIAVHHNPDVKGYRMVVGGVWIATLELPELTQPPTVGVICDDRLRKTADHSDIVQDEVYVGLLHDLQPTATELMASLHGSDYVPPKLPPRPKTTPVGAASAADAQVVMEALPDTVESPHPRPSYSVADLRSLHQRRPSLPVFWTTTEALDAIRHSIQPHAFPFPVLVLTAGQAATLQDALPALQLSQLVGKADVDFVRRVRDRGGATGEHRFTLGRHEVTLHHHGTGTRPDWGEGRPGTPWVHIRDGKTVETGVASDGYLRRVTRMEGQRVVVANPGAHDLPGVSVQVHQHGPQELEHGTLWKRIAQEAWSLALPPSGTPDARLVCSLLGLTGTVRLVDAPKPAVRLSLNAAPLSAIQQVVLAKDSDGRERRLPDLLALWGTHGSCQLESAAHLDRLAPLERLLGHGHLWCADRPNELVLALSLRNGRWTARDPDAIGSADTEVIALVRNRGPFPSDSAWHPVTSDIAIPHVLRWTRDSRRAPTPGGPEALYTALLDLERRHAWGEVARPGLTASAIRDAGRVALFALADAHRDDPILTPTDGGATVTIEQLERDRHRRLVARGGVHLTEPHTFALTVDEWVALGPERLPLRFDDPPELWSASEPEDAHGWLIRQTVHEGELRGWMGLRHPYDPTTGLLLRDGAELLALPEVEERTPCHGLLWPDEPFARAPGPAHRQLLHLAGIELYVRLAELLKTDLDPDRKATAEAYAIAYCVRGHRAGKPRPGHPTLARQVRIRDAEGHPWGTLAQWLEADPNDRPALPIAVPESPADAPTAPGPEATASVGIPGALQRLERALGRPPGSVLVRPIDTDDSWAVTYSHSRSTAEIIVIRCNRTHPLCKVGMAHEGYHHEVWLMECARVACDQHRSSTLPAYPDAQQRLVLQRLAST